MEKTTQTTPHQLDVKGLADSIANNRIYTRNELTISLHSQKTKFMLFFASRFTNGKRKVKCSIGDICRITKSGKQNSKRIINSISHLVYKNKDGYWRLTDAVLDAISESESRRSNNKLRKSQPKQPKQPTKKKVVQKVKFSHSCFREWYIEICEKNNILGKIGEDEIDKLEKMFSKAPIDALARAFNNIVENMKTTHVLYPSKLIETLKSNMKTK